jgi:hypothetical protein
MPEQGKIPWTTILFYLVLLVLVGIPTLALRSADTTLPLWAIAIAGVTLERLLPQIRRLIIDPIIIKTSDGDMIVNNILGYNLTFDLLKLCTIVVLIIAVVILGTRGVLTDQTTATIIGAIVGSLITLRGNFFPEKGEKAPE